MHCFGLRYVICITKGRDAFGGCVAVRSAIPRLLEAHGSAETVCTMGAVTVSPNVPNVVPGECTFTVELRDESQAVIDAMAAAVKREITHAAAQNGLEVARLTVMSDMPPVGAHPALVSCIADCCAASGFPRARIMPSGAAHDAQQIGTIAPSKFLLVGDFESIRDSWSRSLWEAACVF